jgi:DNA polymerase-3 subunit gamma/tau
LLKTLEEPPPHAVFVLCTTDAQKLPLTIVARCQQFPFRRHAVSDIVARLSFIASAEGVAVEPAALELMARTAEGSLRDAIGYLDQLVPLSAGTVTLEEARSILGIADPLAVAQLFASVLSGDAHSALHSLSALYEGGVELRPLVRALMERCRDALVEAISSRDAAARARLSSMLDGLLKLDGEVRRHAEPRFLVEATLVRLAVEGVPATAPAAPAPAATAPAAAVSAAPAVAAPIPPVSAPHPPEGAPHPNTAEGAGGQETPLREQPPTVIPEPSPAPPVHPVEPPAGLDEAWKRVLAELRPVVRGYFREARPEYDGDTLVLSFPYAFHHKSAAEHRAAVEPLVRAHFGDSTRLELVLVEAESSRRAEGAGRAALPENDPRVREALSTFEGSRVVQVRKIEESSQ